MLKFLLDAFSKPFQLYFKPQATLQALHDALPEDSAQHGFFHIFNLSAHERTQGLKVIGSEYLKLLINFIWFPIIFYVMRFFIPEIEAPEFWLSVSFLGMIFIFPLLGMLYRSIPFSITVAWTFFLAFGIASLLHHIFLQQYAYAHFGSVTPDAIGRTVDSQEAVLATAMLGLGLALFARIMGLSHARRYAYIAYGAIIVLAILWIFTAPYLAKTEAIAASNRMMGIILLIVVSGIYLYPFELLLSLLMTVLPSGGAGIWWLSPAYLDEFYLLPVPRLKTMYTYLRKNKPDAARKLKAALKQHPIHSRSLPDLKIEDEFDAFMQGM